MNFYNQSVVNFKTILENLPRETYSLVVENLSNNWKALSLIHNTKKNMKVKYDSTGYIKKYIYVHTNMYIHAVIMKKRL